MMFRYIHTLKARGYDRNRAELIEKKLAQEFHLLKCWNSLKHPEPENRPNRYCMYFNQHIII